METGEVLGLLQDAITLTIQVSAPVLLIGLVVGLLVSVFQAMTQINEQTLSFVPKILAILGALVLFGDWMMTRLSDYTITLFESISTYIQ
jgi:flagellar biosynthesis protein FliQ